MRKALSITAIIIGYLGIGIFTAIELAKYFGWESFYSSASWLAINKGYNAFSASNLAIEITILSSVAVVTTLVVLSIRLASEARVRAASQINVTLPVSLEAAYFGEAYATESATESAKSLDQQYDYLLNK